MTEKGHKVRTPLFPLYSEVRRLLPLFEGVKKSAVTHLISAIYDQTGTPQEPVVWTDPDEWITTRLSGQDQELARIIWEGSGKQVNPRHIYGAYLFINSFDLLDYSGDGIYKLNERGKGFLKNDKDILFELDDSEGLLKLLSILTTKTSGKRANLVPEWGEFLREYSKFGTTSTISDTLRRRLANLVERGLVERSGNSYSISQAGLEYISGYRQEDASEVLHAISAHNAKRREEYRSLLHEMPPYQFEKLVSQLLEAMGYEEVITTKQSGDKGVDVVGHVQLGITSVREVVQVKRMQSNIQRHILDQLRGALPYHHAIRGTIITLSDFSKGCTEAALFPGAAPITLINGTKLIELLEEHEIGIQKKPVELLEIDHDFFEAQVEDDVESEKMFSQDSHG